MLVSLLNPPACSHCILLCLFVAAHANTDFKRLFVCRSYGWCWNSLHSKARWLGGSDGRQSSSGATTAFAVFVPAKQWSVCIPALWQNRWKSCSKIAYFTVFVVWCLFFPLDSVSATEVLLDRHLEDIVNYNRQAVISALQMEVKKILDVQNHRRKVSF